MLRVFVFALVLAISPAIAQEEPIEFSDYGSGFKLVSIDEEGAIATFQGHVITTGTIFFLFEPKDEKRHRMTGLRAAKFFPDEQSRSRLPSVISGPHPSPIKYVSLEPAEMALEQVVGKESAVRMSRGTKIVVRRKVKVVFYDYVASVDCDSRNYFSSQWLVTPLVDQRFASGLSLPHGC